MRFISCASSLMPTVLTLASASPISAHGEHMESSFLEPLPVVLSVSRMPTPLQDVPGAVSVIDQDLIRATGYRNIARLFRLVPGMQVGQERGNDHWVTYHGLGQDFPNNMQVLIDGRSVYSPHFSGGANWAALPIDLADIERIEVIRGSDSATFGSNAFLGVVNIITHHTREDRGPSIGIRVGQSGIRDASARMVTHQGPLGIRVSASSHNDDGFSGLRDDTRMNTASLRADLRLDAASELSLFAGISDGRNGLGHRGTPFNGSGERDEHIDDTFAHLRWTHAPSADEAITLSWYQNREETRDEWEVGAPVLGLAGIPVNQNRSSRRDNLELVHRFAPVGGLRVVWGAELRRDKLDAPILFYGSDSESERLLRAFGSVEWRIADDWLLNAGAMAERFEDDSPRLSPRLFINWQPDPKQSWRAGYARSYRQPSLFERNADVRVLSPDGELLQQRHIANPRLDAQHIDTLELGYRGDLPVVNASLDARLFRERISKLIWRQRIDAFDPIDAARPYVVVPAPGSRHAAIQQALGATRWFNLPGHADLTGLEYQLRFSPWKDGEMTFNHAMMRMSAPSMPQVERTVAPYVASLSWQQRGTLWRSMLTLMRMGPIDAGSGYVPDYRYTVPAYTTLDASIARSVNVAGIPTELRLTGLNLLGKHQELAHRPLQRQLDRRAENQVETQVYLTLTADF